MRKLPMNESQNVLLDSILKRSTIQELFARLYALVQLPMICFDPSFSLIAFAFPQPFYYSHWEWIASKGSASLDTIREYNYFSNQEEMIRAGSAIIFNGGTCDGYPQVCGPVFIKEKLVAYCGIMVEDADLEDTIRLTNMLISAVSAIFQQEEQQDELSQTFVLESDISKQQAEYLSGRYPGNYAFLAISCTDSRISFLQFIKVVLKSMEQKIVGCLNADGILSLLYYGMNPMGEPEAELREFSRLLITHGLIVGYSDVFSRLETIPEHRYQAQLSLNAGLQDNGDPGVYSFIDLYYSLICDAAVEYYGPAVCTLPGITLLAEEDRKLHTEYLTTLDAWLKCKRSKSATAEQMGHHRTTISARLDRISELLQTDLSLCAVDLQMGIDLYKHICPSAFRSSREIRHV